MNKQNRLIDTENKLMVTRWERTWELGAKGDRIKKCTLAIIKQSQGVKYLVMEGIEL